ncbi:HLH domain-containing protein [Cephalotus follicularis]|uniref:HLH domain-containing protein n=1 Tax=Cephalotus follicularis TaxID=3775 RepID=A0A1Q3B0F6_CEPFO|nr:HLH domain-containing protein [Cephalotus follicularis]
MYVDVERSHNIVCLDRSIKHSWAFYDFDNSSGGHSGEKKLAMETPNSSPKDMDVTVAHVGTKSSSRKGNPKYDKTSGGDGGESEHEIHIWTERERRKKMRCMFSSLHALLPQLPAKADKSTIVDEAINYIKTLQQTLQTLQKQKLEKLRCTIMGDYEPSTITTQSQALESREVFVADQGSNTFSMATNMYPNLFPVPLSPPSCFQTWFSPNVVINTCGDDAQISVCSTRRAGLLTTIFYILEKHNLDVVSAHVSSDHYRCMYMIHAHAGGASDHFLEVLSVEETFKLAAGEMNLWLLTCNERVAGY